VIGGRGTGKSALIEALRYAFDIEPKTTTNKKQREDLLARTLPPGTKITVFYETDDHTQYRIERTWNQAPRVFNAKTGEEKTGLHPSHLGEDSSEPVEIYGQKEIYEISKDPEYQLRLLDTYITEDLSSVFEQQTELRRSLENNAQAILSVEKDIVDAQDKVNELPGIRERLNRMEQQEMAARLQRKKDMDTENALLTRATEAIEAVAMALEEVSKAQENTISSELIDESTYSNLPHAEMLGTQRDLLDRIKQTFQDGIQGLIAQLRHIWKEGAVKRSMWQQDYEQEEAVYQQFLRDHPDASADTYISLQKQYQDLESLEKRIKPLEREVADLKQERQKMLEELRILYRKEFNIRHTKTQELNELLGGTVTISVVREGNRKLYRESLKNSFTGTRMSSDNIDHIVSCQDADGYYYDTIALVDAIRNEQKSNNDFSVLESTYGLTEAKRIALTKLAESVLYDLEIFRVPDLPIIKLCVNGQEKSLDELSVGQKCTAILSLILVERNSPLVIDQPEDDLDNRFIFEEIVKTLRHEKERRQFVVATHNANIPVSGDAELIIVLEANESHGWIQCSGSIDDPEIREPVENILEGGREAFRIRQAKYGVE
jgi:hypothetical protein